MAIIDRIVRLTTSIRFIVSIGLLLAVTTFIAWQYHNTTNIDRVFWGSVENSLSSSAYTRHVQQKQGSQSVDQIFQTATSPQNRLVSKTVFVQTGVDEARAVTENIGTPTEDFVRYTDIKTAQNLDFSPILGIWGVTEAQVPGETRGQLYNQSVLGLIPVGNLNLSERRELISIMRDQKAYEYTVVDTKHALPFGRPTYTLELTINPIGYITALKKYAEAVGLNHLEGVDPTEYADAQQIRALITIDGWSHRVTSTNQGGGTKTEQISGWNLKKILPDAPKTTIPVDELQTKLESIE